MALPLARASCSDWSSVESLRGKGCDTPYSSLYSGYTNKVYECTMTAIDPPPSPSPPIVAPPTFTLNTGKCAGEATKEARTMRSTPAHHPNPVVYRAPSPTVDPDGRP